MIRLCGNVLAFVGAILMFPGGVLKTFCYALRKTPNQGLVILAILFFGEVTGKGLVAVGRVFYVKGKKLGYIPAENLLAKDKRPAVIYLRSFALEPLTNKEAR